MIRLPAFYYQNTKISCVSVEEMKEIDRLMVEDYSIQLMQMMENAGAALSFLCARHLKHSVDKKVVILAGSGNNGGGGFVSARRLANFGADVTVIKPFSSLKTIPAQQMKGLEKIPVRIFTYSDPSQKQIVVKLLQSADLIVDALIGYGLSGDPRGLIFDLVQLISHVKTDVIALDVPSGLNADNGLPGQPSIKATSTLTLGLPKQGFLSDQAASHLGKLYLADISIPHELYNQIGLKVPYLFDGDPYIRISRQ
jgi:NAD(P)H-hydrate epimerase